METKLIDKTRNLPDGVRGEIYSYIRHPVAMSFIESKKPILLRSINPIDFSNYTSFDVFMTYAYDFTRYNCVIPVWDEIIKKNMINKGLPIPVVQRVLFLNRPTIRDMGDMAFALLMLSMFGLGQ